jgi:predicted membrane channel-forming protein YqfA (hemolysin III family)
MVVCWASHRGPSRTLCPSVPVVVVSAILCLPLVLLLVLWQSFLLLVLMKSMMKSGDAVLVLALFLLLVLLLVVLPDGIPLPFRPEPPRLRFGSSVLGLLEGVCYELGLVLASHSDPGTSGCLLGVCSSSKSFGKTSRDLVCRSGLEPKGCGLLAGHDGHSVLCGHYTYFFLR